MVVALGFTRLHHRSWNRNSEVFALDTLVQALIVSIFRRVVLFLEFDLVNSYLVVMDGFSWVISSSQLMGCFGKDCYVFHWLI